MNELTDALWLGTKESLPVRERGLKLTGYQALARRVRVAPRVGAWIETYVTAAECN